MNSFSENPGCRGLWRGLDMKIVFQRTCIEKQMFGFLLKLGLEPNVDFYEQYPCSYFVLDFAFIKNRNPFCGLDIEVDGQPWHSTSEQRKRDGFRTHLLKKKGWIVERFGEQFTIEDVKGVLLKHDIISNEIEENKSKW